MRVLTLLILFSVTVNIYGQVCFQTTNFTLSGGNRGLCSGDFNNDGNADIVVSNQPQVLYILLGNGQGSFGAAVIIPDSSNGLYPVSADFNNDGNLDVAIPRLGLNDVRIYYGDGNGNFPVISSFATATSPFRMTTGDFNNDSLTDIATANASVPGNISVLLNNGSGIFNTHTEFPAGASPVDLTTGDFNGDNTTDIALASSYGGGPDSVAILIGNGSGAFSAAVNYPAGVGPFSVCCMDFNNDNYDDVAVANSNSNNVSVFLSQGTNGLFFPAVNYATASTPFSVVSADFNSDGNADLATANFYAANASVLLGNGTGTFASALNYTADVSPWSIITDDFNSDSIPDLATANYGAPTISVLINSSAPTLNVNLSADTICPGGPVTIAVTGASTYTWSSNITNIDTSGTSAIVSPTVTTNYLVTGVQNGCIDSTSFAVTVLIPEVPNICMVTADSSSGYQYNMLYWDNTLYNNVDSFIVYRHDVLTNSYLRIGAVADTDFSFQDTMFNIGGPNGGNPLYSSWKYKLAIKDFCGTTGQQSPFHQTMFVQQNGSNFSWNAYTVENGQANPVTGYSFLRDDSSSNNWHVLVNTSALSSTDPNYQSYLNGNWRIDALGFNCYDYSNGSLNKKAHSNTIKTNVIGINHQNLFASVSIYPNPSSGKFAYEISAKQKSDFEIIIYNTLGETIYSENKSSTVNEMKGIIDLQGVPDGIYLLEMKINNQRVFKKLIVD